MKTIVCFSFSFSIRSGEFLDLTHCHEKSDWSPLEKEIVNSTVLNNNIANNFSVLFLSAVAE